MIVRISKEHYNVIKDQAKQEYPLECCGLLGGRIVDEEWIIDEVFPLTNIDKSSEHFSMDPKEQFAVVKKLRNSNLSLLGNYHSHPYTPSRPSEEDKRLAYDSNQLYGIMSLENKEKPVFKFFAIDEEKNVEVIQVRFME